MNIFSEFIFLEAAISFFAKMQKCYIEIVDKQFMQTAKKVVHKTTTTTTTTTKQELNKL